MAWVIEINGERQEETFKTEDEANQFAANKRGNDWSMKIEVRDTDAPKSPPKPQQPEQPLAAPIIGGLGAVAVPNKSSK